MDDRERNKAEAIDDLEYHVKELKDHGYSHERVKAIKEIVDYLDWCDFDVRYKEWLLKRKNASEEAVRKGWHGW